MIGSFLPSEATPAPDLNTLSGNSSLHYLNDGDTKKMTAGSLAWIPLHIFYKQILSYHN